jgi:hypothetical protein
MRTNLRYRLLGVQTSFEMIVLRKDAGVFLSNPQPPDSQLQTTRIDEPARQVVRVD